MPTGFAFDMVQIRVEADPNHFFTMVNLVTSCSHPGAEISPIGGGRVANIGKHC